MTMAQAQVSLRRFHLLTWRALVPRPLLLLLLPSRADPLSMILRHLSP